MREPYRKGLATYLDPESCDLAREDQIEALTGADAGFAIEPRNHLNLGADDVGRVRKQHPVPCYGEWQRDPARSENQSMHRSSMRENRESLPLSGKRPEREEKPMRRKSEMDGGKQSDSVILPTKAPNKERRCSAEGLEVRTLTKRKERKASSDWVQNQKKLPDGLERIRQRAGKEKDVRFTALMHHMNLERLKQAYQELNCKAAPGVDGVTWEEYGNNLENNLESLLEKLHKGTYHAKPSKRVAIPKPDGGERQLGIAALEDKLVQRVLSCILNAIYEQDFLGFSYGFRPHRNPHRALDALYVGITRKKVNWVFDMDIQGYFDNMSHEWIMNFINHRVGDPRVIRLIKKWLAAGIMDGTQWEAVKAGTPQGAVISPILANVYLHYSFDQWAAQWRTRKARGDVIIVRYADDMVVGFESQSDAEQFLGELRERLAKFQLSLHPQKTRIIQFGRFAARDRHTEGKDKPETFDFLGFTHICSTSRQGHFLIRRKTIRKRFRRKLLEVKEKLRRRMHQKLEDQGRWLRAVVQGYFNYHSIPLNWDTMGQFRTAVAKCWLKTLRRRSHKDRTKWSWFGQYVDQWLPKVRVIHPWPWERLRV
jgi:RNA-directed DNA polymerase